ncbi:MAG: two-component sensor histidine kinase [Cycloclasticus sp. symbiont of Poecilosclerida sp. M]|nr:MAG: two-component sensor histidine kinase [Cycloclasticus sp. symbiont of Poecilosclerida sp. M]
MAHKISTASILEAVQQKEKTTDKLIACPYNKGFYLSAEQAWSNLKVFHAYQLILSAAFFVLFASETGPSLFGQSNAALFYSASLAYFALTLFSTALIRHLSYKSLVQFKILIDIIALSLLMHASGGITSGLGVLLAVSVAAGGLMAGGVCTLAFAALATFAVLGEQLYADYKNVFDTTAYTYTSALSTSFFAIAALALVLTKRAEDSEQVIHQQSQDIYTLELINGHIIEQLSSGVIVIDANKNILLKNKAANHFVENNIKLGKPLAEVSTDFSELLDCWVNSPKQQTAIIEGKAASPRIQLQFHRLATDAENAYLIFLDDLSVVDQQVQQQKLALLGGFTARIAHEIRNPLGAISHAGQLLAESDQIPQDDRRLLDIIHQQSERVNGIVKSILNLSRLEQTTVDVIDMSTWLKEFEVEFTNEFGLNQSPLIMTKPTSTIAVLFDKNQLKQIIDNLCSNALKHGQQDIDEPNIMLTLGIQKNSQQTYLAVSDNGKGMNPDIVERIFEPFFTTSSSGTGLGLYISNQLAELNHATLRFTQNSNGGSCFTLYFNSKIV